MSNASPANLPTWANLIFVQRTQANNNGGQPVQIPSFLQDCICEFDATAGAVTIITPITTTLGNGLEFLDVTMATSNTHTVLFKDPNGYKFQDPDTLALSVRSDGGYLLSTPRNITWRLTVNPLTSTPFWAAR